ncbi:MAG: hypothetical protein AB203_00435 [Parcubacteria bacterium C7867-008]|nr:MAG: hypothetical protein AB203_00435 [Parcubacteria bacterium C7867-008]
MDANTLLELIQLLEADEGQFTIGARIEEIRTLLSQNDPAQSTAISTKLTELFTEIASSRANLFSQTELAILKGLDAVDYFGSGLTQALTEITSGSKTYELTSRLSEFYTERSTKYNKLVQMKNSMLENGLVAYEQEEDEIALTIPGKEVDASELAEHLKTFSEFLRAVQECTLPAGQTPTPAEIVRVSRGSLNFFAQVDPATLKAVLEIIGSLATIYLAGVDIRKKFNSKTPLSEDEQASINQLAETIAQKRVDAFVAETAAKLAKDNHELGNRVSRYLKILIKWMPLGIHLEVVVAKTVEPVDLKTSEGKQIRAKQATLLKVNEMYSLPMEHLKLPEPQIAEQDVAIPAEEPTVPIEPEQEVPIEPVAPAEPEKLEPMTEKTVENSPEPDEPSA